LDAEGTLYDSEDEKNLRVKSHCTL